MSNWIIYSIGFIAQILFSGRLIVQWLSSEKQKKVVTPSLFWFFSLLASFLLFVYGYLREDFAIMFGQSLTYFIYIRNLHLQKQWGKIPVFVRAILLLVPVFIVVYYYSHNEIHREIFFKNENIPIWLLLLGVVGHVIFTFRFIYQWLYSERKKESSLPLGFWLLSISGALIILSYAVLRKDPVLMAGHSFGLIIYLRNLVILKKENA